ncbi:MAG: hypothetical protein D6796_13110 [Caldilineae bacterium]|nr:MAG: hypothetical protein D6796_13110 [Caldilineae bacterium]
MASYTKKFQKIYDCPAEEMGKKITDTLTRLGGKFTDAHAPSSGVFSANFNKKIGGRPFNNRVTVEIRIKPQDEHRCTVMMRAYPVDPLGNKLAFGVRGQPAKMVIDTLVGDWQTTP